MFRWSRSFLGAAGGNVTILFALSVVPLLLAAGTAIDYLRYANSKAKIQAALDGAALAAALPDDKTDDERKAIAKAYFESNLPSFNGDYPAINVAIGATSVKATVDTTMTTSFMRVAGINHMDIDEFAEVMRPFAGTAEVVMVLDYSGSMNSNKKYQSMRTAATTMIDGLDAAIDDGKLKMGLVPFSAMVYTSMPSEYVSQYSATSTWTGCTQDRIYPYNTTVDTPTSDPQTKWGYFDNTSENKGGYGCSAYQTKGLKIVPLTTNMTTIKTKLNAMRPLGNTNIPLGAEFGWNLLDPQAPFSEGAPYSDSKTRKFLIMLTDGVQTSKYWGDTSDRSVENGKQTLLKLCTSMRDKGVTVFTIAYDIKDPEVTDLLSQCAPGRYFEPDAGVGTITSVFNEIASQIKNQVARLSK
ncbi:MAG: VWA domain-containing protein [Alphaproteobacteria bacterium]|nr:VWA domain-containing protein [Alphaproteobacteria bacterium]